MTCVGGEYAHSTPEYAHNQEPQTIADISIWSLNVPELEKDLSPSVSERIAIVDTHLDTRELQFVPIVLRVLEIKTASFADGFISERWVVRSYISLLLFSPCIVGSDLRISGEIKMGRPNRPPGPAAGGQRGCM